MIDYCYHCHTKRCGHAFGEDEEFVKKAIEAKYSFFGFSDHLFVPGVRGTYEQIDDYVSSINQLKQKYKKDINIYIGFEAEFSKDLIDEYQYLLKDKKIDYFILGQHCRFINGNFTNYTSNTLYMYLEDLIEGMKSGYFLYVAHPDFFGIFKNTWDEECTKIAKKICEASIKYDVPLEINGQGFLNDRPGRLPYPNENFWKIAGEYKCKVVTGVDAHLPESLINFHKKKVIHLVKKYNLNFINNLRIK